MKYMFLLLSVLLAQVSHSAKLPDSRSLPYLYICTPLEADKSSAQSVSIAYSATGPVNGEKVVHGFLRLEEALVPGNAFSPRVTWTAEIDGSLTPKTWYGGFMYSKGVATSETNKKVHYNLFISRHEAELSFGPSNTDPPFVGDFSCKAMREPEL